jgi:putative nucleotidyltransferase with HDIG domain
MVNLENGQAQSKKEKFRHTIRGFLLIVTALMSYLALVFPIALRQDSLPLQAGDVASSDLTSPRTVSYESEILTTRAKNEAANAISPIYLPADPSINRGQLEKLNRTLDFISSVRSDPYADEYQKIDDLKLVQSQVFDPEIAGVIIDLSEEHWITVQDESRRILELIMRENIRDYQLPEVVNRIPGLISYSFSAEEIGIIQYLVQPYIVPNSLYSQVETERSRQDAENLVAPVIKTYAEGQAIVLRGQVITAEQYEALVQLNLIRPEKLTKDYIASVALVVVFVIFIILYFSKRKNTPLSDIRSLLVIAVSFLLFLVAAKIIIPNRTIIPFFFPLPAFALLLVSLFNFEISFILPIILSILVTYGVTTTPDLLVFYIITSLVGASVLGKGKNFVSFVWSALSIAFAGFLVVLAYRLPNPTTDMVGLVTLFGTIVLNGFASASIALLLQFLLSQLLGLPTPLYLTELSRSDHPLLRFILQNAPGTYQHTLQVANLAEQAANAIGADALLTRVGVYYHDAGKAQNPSFFIENQPQGSIDSHDDMDPVIAAQTIIAHIHDGVKLAEKYNLPPRIQDFIREHHGTQVTKYQYNRALEQQADNPSLVDIELFRYPGPQPRSKETGISMLADITEARARSTTPKNEEELVKLLNSVFDNIYKEGLLKNTNLTLKDLTLIQASFHKTLMNTYHPRIAYPEDRQEQTRATAK